MVDDEKCKDLQGLSLDNLRGRPGKRTFLSLKTPATNCQRGGGQTNPRCSGQSRRRVWHLIASMRRMPAVCGRRTAQWQMQRALIVAKSVAKRWWS